MTSQLACPLSGSRKGVRKLLDQGAEGLDAYRGRRTEVGPYAVRAFQDDDHLSTSWRAADPFSRSITRATFVCMIMQNIGMVMRSCQPLNARYGAAESARR